MIDGRPRRNRLSCLVAAAAITLIALPATAQQEPDLARAKALFNEAQVRFNLGEYEESLARYREAYQLASLPGLLFNIGNCHYNLGHHRQAIEFYQKYLIQQPQAPNRADVEALISKSQEALAAQPSTPVSPPSATQPATAPASAAGQPRPPTAPASEAPTNRQGPAVAAPPDRPPTRTPLGRKVLLWSGIGLTAAALVAGAVTGVHALHKIDAFKDDDTPLAEQLDLRDSGETLATISTISFAAAGTLAVATSLYYWFGYRRPVPRAVAVAPARRGRGLLVSLEGRF